MTELSLSPADRFAASTLANVVREYPNHTGHVMNGPDDAKTPRQLHPIFFGCFDWHSCVHGYWQLARLHRLFPGLAPGVEIEQRFAAAFIPENLAIELAYLQQHRAFERPYGWAWLLMLCDELSRQAGEAWQQCHRAILPMGELIAERFGEYLPKADHPVRSGAHANSAFAITLAMEYAVSHRNIALENLLKSKAVQWYGRDVNCQAWEPSQSDFLSPALMEAACMSRVLPVTEFHAWLDQFLPELADRQPAALFAPAVASDRTDGQIAHLDGLNLSRAWCFGLILGQYPADHPLAGILENSVVTHLDASLGHIFDHYAGEHWLATFALLAVTGI